MPEAKNAKTLNFLSLPTAGLLVLFFFLPWVKITCGNYTLAESSGYQLAKGEISPGGDLDQIAEQVPGAELETTDAGAKPIEARP